MSTTHTEFPPGVPSTAVPLLSVGVLGADDLDAPQDPEDPGSTSGGLDVGVWFATHLVAQVRPCGDAVHGILATWAADHHLAVILDQPGATDMHMHLLVAGVDGFIEAVYRLRSGPPTRGRTTLFWVGPDGSAIAPEALLATSFASLDIAALDQRLTIATACGTGP